MPSATPTLKRHNHRVHPCKIEKKDELLELILSKNSDKKIIVVTSTKTELTNENVAIVSDEELAANPDMRCDMLISYDLPQKAITYMARIARADTYATIMLDSSEEKLIHPIETLIGRTIMQELVEGISEVPVVKEAQPVKKEFKPRDKKQEYKPREDRPKKEYSKDSKGERKPWEKKKKSENKYLGKDENGKAIFSGKSGERNHHYDGTPKQKAQKLTGKKINIKSLKKKEQSE